MRDKNKQKKASLKIHRKIAIRNRQYVQACKELGKCLICGESRTVCLVYHHRDPSRKKFQIGDISGWSLEVIYQEMQKCDLVCANCHRIIHAENRLKAAVKEDTLPLFDNNVD